MCNSLLKVIKLHFDVELRESNTIKLGERGEVRFNMSSNFIKSKRVNQNSCFDSPSYEAISLSKNIRTALKVYQKPKLIPTLNWLNSFF